MHLEADPNEGEVMTPRREEEVKVVYQFPAATATRLTQENQREASRYACQNIVSHGQLLSTIAQHSWTRAGSVLQCSYVMSVGIQDKV